MDMFKDMQGMILLKQAGLMATAETSKINPEAVVRVTGLIANEPALPQSDQLSANGVNGKSFSLDRIDFAARAQPVELRKDPTACCIRFTFTAASFGSSRATASRPRPTVQAGKIQPRSRPGAPRRYFCSSRTRQARTVPTWRTVTFWSMRIPA